MTAGRWYNSLRFQIVVLLTLALLPLGAVAIYQTSRVEAEADRNAQRALLALTGRAAKSEELIIQSAFGVSRFIATVAQVYADDTAKCTEDLARFVDQNPLYARMEISLNGGRVLCASRARPDSIVGRLRLDPV